MHTSPPNNLDLALIAPGTASKFSANLWHFLRANRAASRFSTGFLHREEGTVWLGYMHDGDFCGTRLMQVLCEGAKATTGCYVGLASKLTLIETFWAGYIQLGRCFLDPHHSQHFIDPRWREEGDQRTCLWCGHTQHKQRWTEQVQREAWCSVAVPGGVSA